MPVNFYPPLITRVPLMVENLKSCRIVDFDSSKEGSWCTECNTINLCSLQSNVPDFIYFYDHFWQFFLIFSEMVHCRELRFFLRCIQCCKTLLLSYQNQQ